MSPSSVEKILGNVDVDNMIDKSAWEKRQREMRKERSGRQSGIGFSFVQRPIRIVDQSDLSTNQIRQPIRNDLNRTKLHPII